MLRDVEDPDQESFADIAGRGVVILQLRNQSGKTLLHFQGGISRDKVKILVQAFLLQQRGLQKCGDFLIRSLFLDNLVEECTGDAKKKHSAVAILQNIGVDAVPVNQEEIAGMKSNFTSEDQLTELAIHHVGQSM